MNHTRAPSPLATARPKNSSSSISSQHQQSPASQGLPPMPSSSKPRGSTPSTSRSPQQPQQPQPHEGRPGRAPSKDSLKQKMAKVAEEPTRPSKADEQLQVLRSDFDSLRQHLTCKICDRLLYQPYTIACGHTYCYSCLCTWFVNNKSRKTCPDCRTVVSQLPAPAYVIRDMTNVLINRVELLPTGETIELHKKWQKEETDAVQQDKDNIDPRAGGLFKGCFKSAGHASRPSLQVIRDQEDGVERCPVCSWELEDGECVQCGLYFDDNGELTWTDSFTGFSDMDEMSEQDLSGEDLDAEMDMDDPDYDGFTGNWEDYYPDDGNFMMQRFLQHGIPPHGPPHGPFYQQRRPMSHSEAGSRRSYSQSIVSDLITEEMDTVEEEDEEGLEEDSSMNDFIDDDEERSSVSATDSSSAAGQTPQPSGSQSRYQGRARRVVESETSSTISSVIEEEDEDEDEDEDEEDQGPVRRGQRNRAHTRILNRANGSREPSGPPSSTSTDVSTDELDEDTQALLQSQGWMLQHHGADEMGEDDDSDGGRTTVGSTVGWDATAISNDRVRMGGSLTPTADRPRPNNTIRPPSRVGNPLRRQASVLSTANAHYEDGEADDDDSDVEHDGDITMAINSLRSRRSRTQLRNNAAAFTNFNNRYASRGLSQGNPIDVDVDDNSDHSQDGRRRARQQSYNPRISRLFADHQRALQEIQGNGLLVDLEPRSITPIARPRTSNRNRPSPAQAFSPFLPPAPTRIRTPLMNNTSNTTFNSRGPTSPPRRTPMTQNLAEAVHGDSASSVGRTSSISSTSNSSAVLTPGTSTPTSQQSTSTVSQPQAGLSIEAGDRPPSRVNSRPPSAAGRRNSAGFSPVYPQFPHSNVGLNIQGRIFPQQAGNPWGAFVQPRIRNRNSRQVLREQSSTATLRAVSSRANIREPTASPQNVRTQASRIDLRPQPSRRRLNPQASVRTLRASEHARPPPSPTMGNTNGATPASQTPRYTPEETNRLARELINTRMQVLRPPGSAPARNNPFVPGFRRQANASDVPAGAPTASFHSRSNSNESATSTTSAHTATMGSSSPGLTRRRSNRHMGAAPPGVLPTVAHGGFPSVGYSAGYGRGRQGSIGSASFEMALDAGGRGMSPMMATSLI